MILNLEIAFLGIASTIVERIDNHFVIERRVSHRREASKPDGKTARMSSNDDVDAVDIREQYRIMAQMEANIRVKDKTGFDMVEYKEQRLRLEKERLQEEEELQGRYHTKPNPKLPDHSSSYGNDGTRPSSGTSHRPEEPPLPFTRANRRFVQSGKSNNNNNRARVPELCQGVVVTNLAATEASTSCCKEHVLQCWGCSIYLTVNALATLVQCPECLTISPVT